MLVSEGWKEVRSKTPSLRLRLRVALTDYGACLLRGCSAFVRLLFGLCSAFVPSLVRAWCVLVRYLSGDCSAACGTDRQSVGLRLARNDAKWNQIGTKYLNC